MPVEGNLFVLGKLEGASLVKSSWRSLMVSSKGREGLLGSIQQKKKFSFMGGGVTAVLSIPVMIFAPSIDTSGPSMFCESALTDTHEKCSDTASSESGDDFRWTVTKPGDGYMVKGGFSHELEISGGPAAAPAGAPVATKGSGAAAPSAGGELAEQITMLNELCPDTFCEGVYNYTFKKLECPEATKCVLSFEAKDVSSPCPLADATDVRHRT